jgi:hypothetical protein
MITVNLVSRSAKALPDHSLDSSSDITSEGKMLRNFSRYRNRARVKIVGISDSSLSIFLNDTPEMTTMTNTYIFEARNLNLSPIVSNSGHI